MSSLFIVMPAYNEEANIERAVTDWYAKLPEGDDASRLVVADAGSSDRTHEILLGLQRRYPKLEILMNTEKQHGPKVLALYGYAVQSGAGYVFQTDSDGQTDPAEFGRFWDLRDRYDAVIGFRKKRGDGLFRALSEQVVCLLLRFFFGVRVPDANAPFRLMKTDLLKKYLGRMEPDYELPNIMLTAWFAYYRENLAFRPISFRPRQDGTNSVNMKKIVRAGLKALGDFRRFRREMDIV